VILKSGLAQFGNYEFDRAAESRKDALIVRENFRRWGFAGEISPAGEIPCGSERLFSTPVRASKSESNDWISLGSAETLSG